MARIFIKKILLIMGLGVLVDDKHKYWMTSLLVLPTENFFKFMKK
jgi:hypothetical protein